MISSLLLGLAAWTHWDSYEWVVYRPWAPSMRIKLLLLLALPLGAYFAVTSTIHLAARLTAWEAAYRGFRLPPSRRAAGLVLPFRPSSARRPHGVHHLRRI